MPGMSGVEATRELTRRLPSVAVLVVTVSASEANVLDALEAGAAGYLLKDSGPEEIVRALEAAADGDTPLSPRVAGLIVHRARGRAGDVERRAPTSPGARSRCFVCSPKGSTTTR